jgi:dCTP deaminase
MGDRYFRTADEAGKEQRKTLLSEGEAFTIPAGQFAYLFSKEEVRVPVDTVAFISMRTGIKFQGLINVSGFHVDPGYKGKLVYAVYNASPSPVQICENDPIFKIWFCSLDERAAQKHAFAKEGLYDISSDTIRGMSREILSLQSVAEKIRELESKVNERFAEQKPTIDNLTFVWRAIIIGVVGAVILALLTISYPALRTASSKLLEWLEHLAR